MSATETAKDSGKHGRGAYITGWIAIGISVVITTMWAMWGTIEAFHEGWWAETIGGRLVQTSRYLSPMAITMALSLIAVFRPKFGAVIYFLIGTWFSWFIFSQRWGNIDLGLVLSWLPVTGLVVGVGLLYWFARIGRPKLAYALVLGIPLAASLACAIEPVWRISQRPTERSLEATTVERNNGPALVWAPAGPGWVREAKDCTNWLKSVERIRHVSADGLSLVAEPVDIWRLPTAEELVASMTRQGKNAGGAWDPAVGRAGYEIQPDKEAPLWDIYSETIYYWTATEVGEEQVYMVDHHGAAWPKRKAAAMGSRGFRAVKDLP